MILPIHVFGDPVLRKETTPVEADSEELQTLIDDMIETMHAAAGIGLAAPQVGRPERLFVIDLSAMVKEEDEDPPEIPEAYLQPVAFINPEILHDADPGAEYEEGCLSIPDVREIVRRPGQIRVRYRDRAFQSHEIDADGMLARVVQHELDHLNGVLFIDRISPLKRRLLKRRLRDIARGDVEADYELMLRPS